MANAILLLRPQLTLFAGRRRSSVEHPFPASFDSRLKPNPRFPPSFAAAASSPSSPSSWEQEEQRWLREEQRWLREEQRWLREELRWSSEREALIREIASLRLRIEDLEGGSSPLAPAVNAVLMAEKERRLLTNSDHLAVEEDEVEEIGREGTKIPEEKGIMVRRTLRMGSEGEDVREMQEALQRLGFFSGEDDMDYSSFSSGTDSAVKTWQASLGATENGIMTAELLEKLFVEQSFGDSSQKRIEDQRGISEQVERNMDGTNGAAASPVRKYADIHEAVTKEADVAEIGASLHRVFLLGENRWEEPSRLQSDKTIESGRAAYLAQCLTCRGEGRLMCMECDGSGEPNVEPQFLEWIGDGAKCPYCDGIGYIVCDACEGKSIVQN